MRVINVVVTNDTNGLVSIDSFGIIDEQDSQAVVEQAESMFLEKIVEIQCEDVESEEADNLRNKIEENWIGEGYYEIVDDMYNTQVFLSWSSIDNVQL